MAATLSATLKSIEEKTGRLIAQQEELHRRLEEVTAERDELRRQIGVLSAELDKAGLDNKFLRMSHRLADNPEAVVETRKTIAALIRKIDRCIALLKE